MLLTVLHGQNYFDSFKLELHSLGVGIESHSYGAIKQDDSDRKFVVLKFQFIKGLAHSALEVTWKHTPTVVVQYFVTTKVLEHILHYSFRNTRFGCI